MQDVRPDLVIHAAGRVGGIQANIAAPVAFLDDNLMIGRNVVIGAHRAGVRRLINLGSTCIYPAAAPNPLREDMLLTGLPEKTNEGYALAKLMVLRLCSYLTASDPTLHYKTLIPCNLYGPYDYFHPGRSHLIAAIVDKIHKAKIAGQSVVDIWGDGRARREVMYAPDLADAILAFANRIEDLPDTMNVGSGVDHSVEDYYHLAARVIGWTGTFALDPSRPVGVARKLSDISRLNEFGWKARTSLGDGIRRTYDYYLQEYAPDRTGTLVTSEIA